MPTPTPTRTLKQGQQNLLNPNLTLEQKQQIESDIAELLAEQLKFILENNSLEEKIMKLDLEEEHEDKENL
ncbi:unnamed protein product [Adineta steineri]|uniref:Uncharacterized protein n=1 Tax=Adineta steineri TaxID=433720 RepID=A0A818YR59_9BILA|nr:unnamed protein product [Adineta steineri]CAF3760156.1 unnamed protein product [Adineta steineri]